VVENYSPAGIVAIAIGRFGPLAGSAPGPARRVLQKERIGPFAKTGVKIIFDADGGLQRHFVAFARIRKGCR
jgi:hypothetical protein